MESNEEIRSFFEGWALYQKIIRHNYMAHRELGVALEDALQRLDGVESVLDLGSGDGSMAINLLERVRPRRYTGIDLSAMALAEAERNLSAVPGAQVRLLQADMSEFLGETEERFDVFVVGFSLHHLDETAKRRFLRRAKARSAGEACLLLYDVFRDRGETRKSYAERYLSHCRDRWPEMTQREQELIAEHVRGFDDPADEAGMRCLANDTGWAPGPVTCRDESGFHRLLEFRG